MGRSAEEDRDVLALPLKRPRRHVSSGSSPSRVHPPSFDPDAARKAWRQVARVRGGGPGLGVDPGRRRPSLTALLGVALAVGVVWALWSLAEPSPDAPPPVETVAAVAEPSTSTSTPRPTTEATPQMITPAQRPDPSVPMPEASIGHFSPKSGARMAPPATEDASQIAAPAPPKKTSSSWQSAIPMPEPVAPPAAPAPTSEADERTPQPPPTVPLVRRGPPVAPGSPAAGLAALKKLPKSDRDRPPLEGVGVSGIHVDRLDLGSAYDDGICMGSNRSYSAAKTKTVNVCFRAVHRRQTERVLVKWSKNDRLVRRAWVVIPASHAYRTRAGLRLRDSYVGRWSVSVESADGVVLASGDFKVKP